MYVIFLLLNTNKKDIVSNDTHFNVIFFKI